MPRRHNKRKFRKGPNTRYNSEQYINNLRKIYVKKTNSSENDATQKDRE